MYVEQVIEFLDKEEYGNSIVGAPVKVWLLMLVGVMNKSVDKIGLNVEQEKINDWGRARINAPTICLPRRA